MTQLLESKLRFTRAYGLALLGFIFQYDRCLSQEVSNPLIHKQWITTGLGATSADGVSWIFGGTYGTRGEEVLTAFRCTYSQELIASREDSCLATKSKTLELGAMWGDGWQGKSLYAFGAAGMGFNYRWYCNDVPGDTVPEKISRYTLGIPVHLEAGMRITEEYRIAIMAVGNWNFLQPFYGGMISFSYWPGRKRQ